MANNSRVQITLGFNVDTDQAKRQINDLVNQLRSIQSTPTTLVDDTSLRKASAAAAELQGHLQKAVDVNTGKLDLSRFSASLKQSGKQLSDYRRDLEAIGPTGSQAFLSVAKSIATAETPLLRANKHLNDFLTTMKNTAKWQISSSIMLGFMGAVQQAYGYSQSLNESLNNIRIVTGYNTEQMAEFASQANKAAKALSTTTTDYTNASLIYLQQGLSDEEVQKRTDITVKMANVARDSVDNVSNQLTAIWNNFYEEGGKSLEYYADVMTALGAKTASSTEEIAGGLEKFAAIGDTIGLSYEYAASALATITSNTRQSEEVVGTALKTIFARIQGLNLGETLEDGTSLNKYSEALAKVGVSIFEQNGELKAMDNILDELAARWGTLNSAQQTSLAQTVAGVRQYTQLIALMENWNNGDEDSFMANIQTTQNAEGALNQQADIYADSWEAARDRVKAAQEDVYNSLIDDEFFINLDNVLVPVLEVISGITEGLGGLEGIVLTIGGILAQVFAKDAPRMFSNLLANISVFTGKANKMAIEMQQQTKKHFQSYTSASSKEVSGSAIVYERINALQQELNQNAAHMSKSEKEQYELKIEQLKVSQEQIRTEGQRLDSLKEQEKSYSRQLDLIARVASRRGVADKSTEAEDYIDQFISINNNKQRVKNKGTQKQILSAEQVKNVYRNGGESNFSANSKELKAYKAIVGEAEKAANAEKKRQEIVQKTYKNYQEQKNIVRNIAQEIAKIENLEAKGLNIDSIVQATDADDREQINATKETIKNYIIELDKLDLISDESKQSYQDLLNSLGNNTELDAVKEKWKNFKQSIDMQSTGPYLSNSINDQLLDTIEQMGKELDLTDDELQDFNNRMQEFAANIIQGAKENENFKGTLKGIQQEFQAVQSMGEIVGTSLTNVLGNVAQIAGALQGVSNSIDIIMDEEQDGVDKVASAVSSLTISGMALSGVFKTLKGASASLTKYGAAAAASAKTAGTAISGMGAAAGAAGTAIGTIALPLTIIIGILMGGFAIVKAYNNYLEEQAQKAKQTAEESQKLADSLKEENVEFIKSTKELDKALKKWEETSQNLEGINSIIDDLNKKYNLQSANLAILTGKQEYYNQVLQEAYEKEKQLNQEQSTAIHQAAQDKTNEIFATLKSNKATNFSNSSTGTWFHFSDNGDTNLSEERYEINDLASNLLSNYSSLSSPNLEEFYGRKTSQLRIDLDQNNPKSLAEYYSFAKTFYEEGNKILDKQTGAAATLTKDKLDGVKKTLDSLEPYKDYLEDILYTLSFEELKTSNFNDELFQVDSLEDYQNWLNRIRENLKKTYKDEEKVNKLIQDLENISLNSSIQQFSQLNKSFETAAQLASGISKDNIQKAIKNALGDKYSDEAAIELLGRISFNSIDTIKELEEQIEAGQHYLNYHKLKIKIETGTDIIQKIYDGTATKTDYEQAMSQYAEEIKAYGGEVEFLKLSEKERSKLFSQWAEEAEKRQSEEAKYYTDVDNEGLTILDKANDKAKQKSDEYEKTKEQMDASGFIQIDTVDEKKGPIINKFAKQKIISNLEKDVKDEQENVENVKNETVEIILDSEEAEKTLNKLKEEAKIELKPTNFEDTFLTKERELQEKEKEITEKKKELEDNTLTSTERETKQQELNDLLEERTSIYNDLSTIAATNEATAKSELETFIATGEALSGVAENIKTVKVEDIVEDPSNYFAKIDAEQKKLYQTMQDAEGTVNFTNRKNEYDAFVSWANALRDFVKSYLSAMDESAKRAEDAAEIIVEVFEQLDKIHFDDIYDANIPIDNRIEEIRFQLEEASRDASKYTSEELTALYKELDNLLSYKQSLLNEQIARKKIQLMEDIPEVEFNADNTIANEKTLRTTYQGKLDNARSEANKEGISKEARESWEKQISLYTNAIKALNEYNSLLGNIVDLEKERKYQGKDYTLRNSALELDIYQAIDKELNDISDGLNDINREKSKAYGKNYIEALQKENKQLEKQRESLLKKKELAKIQLQIDRQDLQIAIQKYQAQLGINAVFDAQTGQLQNYGEILSTISNRITAEWERWKNAADDVKASIEANITALQNMMSVIQTAYTNTINTENLITEIDNSYEEAWDQILSNNSEMWRHKIEVELQIDENELEILDKKLSILGDSFYSMAEAAGLMMDKVNKIGSQETFDDIAGSWQELQGLFNSNSITQKDFVDNAQMLFDQVSGNIDKLMEIDKEMMEYYSKAIDAAGEEMDYYTSQLEHFSSVLDHYRNIVEIVNGEMDYERTGAILEGRVKTLQNEMKVSEDYYAMLKREQDAAKAALASATGEKERELLEANLKAITEAVIEAEEEMLSKTEEWAEATKELMENTMAKAARDMEMAFTDGLTFDFLSDSMDRLSTYQDEYLTKTNQMYETEKLMRTAQQAADKTQNKVAKEKLQGYIRETSELQNKNKLSHLELEIQQAKYDLLVAEIALEEAQNAKSTVRLQRDSEGNFGYVYTADSEKISQAEQDLADAENDLYNIGLEAANDYGQKRIELQQQLADDLIELEERRVNGEFKTEEDYYRARDQLISEYTDLFTAYSNQYTTAMGVDADIQEEAWVTSYQNIIDKTNMWSEDSNAAFDSVGNGIGEWKNIVNGYLGECETAYGEWREVVETESKVVQDLMADTQGAVNDVTTASDELATEVTTVVIPGIEAELGAIRELTTEYASHRDAVYDLMNQYIDLMNAINDAISAAAGIGNITVPTVKVDDTNTPPPKDPGDGGGGDTNPGGGGASTSGGNMAYAQSLYWQGKVTNLNEAAQIAGSSVTEFKQAANYLASQTYGTGKDRWFTSEFGANLPANYGQQYNSGWAAIEDNQQAQDRINEILGFDTGGYTGIWGTEGRLAFLHQKELVLKPEDTENFLAATGLLRDIANVIDLQAMYNQMTSPTASMVHSGGGFFEQSVHIEASFPNVQDRNEIQEAFNNLLNTASQYANRK